MGKQAEAGKGSKRRKKEDQDAFATGWDRIFGNKKVPEPKKKDTE